MKDLIDELQDVTRRVGDAALPAGAAKVVSLERTYAADIDDVWDAISNPERIPRWFLPISGDLRLGGNYQLEGNAGGEIRTCEPPRHLQVTWTMGEPGPLDDSIVDVRLTESDGGTRFVLEHTAVSPPEFWDTYGPGAVGVGWDLAVLGLRAHLAGVDMGPPEELEIDPKMHEAMTFSSQAWGTALSATGEDDASVAAKVAATTAFYVPPPE